MRLRFTDTLRIKKLAKDNMDTGYTRLRRWWSNKYNLPGNHDLFEKQTITDIMTEWYEDLWARKEELEKQLENGSIPFDDRGETMRTLTTINAELGEQEADKDDLIDKWEKEIAEGKDPDLTEGD